MRAVAAANPRTVVVVNSGSPVLLPWREQVGAILVTYFGGQEYGTAIGDMLRGTAEPGGRLPTTWPATLADVPVLDVTPRDGVLRYDEGIHIGYRAWLRESRAPAFPFGAGVGYTTWELGTPTVAEDADGWVVEVPVANVGSRPGKHVVQVYAERPDSSIERPVRWLVGWAVVRSEGAGEEVARIPVSRRALAHWDGGWQVEPGRFTLRIGSAVDTLPHQVVVSAGAM